MPASDENIRRRWYSVVPSPDATVRQIEVVGQMILDQLDESVQFSDHGAPFDIHLSAASRSAPYYRGPIRSDLPRASSPQAHRYAVRGRSLKIRMPRYSFMQACL